AGSAWDEYRLPRTARQARRKWTAVESNGMVARKQLSVNAILFWRRTGHISVSLGESMDAWQVGKGLASLASGADRLNTESRAGSSSEGMG
ncbi:MAG: hypothetical protein V3U22_03120, partial [Vicinamibacteria bacterium]